MQTMVGCTATLRAGVINVGTAEYSPFDSREALFDFPHVVDDLAVVGQFAGLSHHHFAAQFGDITDRGNDCIHIPRGRR